MKIHIKVNHTHLWMPHDLLSGKIKGSEEMVVEFARAMSKRGHEVKVFCSLSERSAEDEGVSYVGRNATSDTADVLIAFKNPDALMHTGYKKKYMWTALPGQSIFA